MLAVMGCAAEPGSSGSADTDGSHVAVVATEYAFEPSQISVPVGEVTFTIRNEGDEEHEFEILRGDRVVDEVEGLIPGLERDLTVRLEPGAYLIVCRLADHFQRGMVADLTVSG